MNFNQRLQPVSTREAVYMELREQILKLQLPPGTPLSENETSLLFKVSRTPVRESFLRLAQEGLVQVLPQRGTFVSLIDTALVEEARFMREQLEKAVILLACSHFPPASLNALEQNLLEQQACVSSKDDKSMFELDEAFHRILFDGCSKMNIWSIMQQMNAHLNRSRMLRLVDDHDWKDLFEQHARMAEAIKKQDGIGAQELMVEHLSLNIADQALLKEKYPDYYK
ncbi:DNA-binding GntR family transcriptional regulator [Paenibacillus endophyticus]|uniref:DNA-binding GntR family transcriptional regulator n=1 Tax=Paenibacillus endophyticus TaxID=1294268 RepID=A0A7W5C6H1_9BACL|nr:GntR family transcriptional regulator [Paenibacillus endophyticus]MBB3151009.1 DNA-binding GntR family transcriptional regulator [Paenibacillus endophyticus]